MIEHDLSRALWRKSSRSGSTGGECVEVACLETVTAIRDSKNPDGDVLFFTVSEWAALSVRLKRGEYR
jgi:Domain of unknown function (DUF397)